MLKKTITYIDLDGNKTSEELYFNMSSVDMTRFVAKYSDYTNVEEDDEDESKKALQNYINGIIGRKDMKAVVEFIEDLILSAYGVRPDASHFIKSKEQREIFSYSVAYAKLFEELLSDEKKINDFITGIVDSSNSKNPAAVTKASVVG